VCAYWLTAREGFKARRGGDANSSETAAIARSANARLMYIFLGHTSGAASRTGAEP
jgi:hypothetical protein